MAQKVQVLLVDDIEGGPAEETVCFGLDGVSYEIDLNRDNAKTLRESLSKFIDNARSQGRSKTPSSRRGRSAAKASNGNTAEIREWAKSHGHKVSERGRIPQSVVEAFEQAKAS